MTVHRRWPAKTARTAIVGAILTLVCAVPAGTQQPAAGVTVFPVTIQLTSDVMAAALTIHNHRDSDLKFQIRSFEWNQAGGADQLAPSDALLVSPPLGVVKAGGDQTVRMVLRRSAQGNEATYRILFDEIPPPPRPGTITIALRLSIPIFVEPPSHVPPHLAWSVESDDHAAFLVAVNDGGTHEAARDIVLTSPGGQTLKIENTGPYVLAGSTRRWRILTPLPSGGGMMHLAAHTDTSGSIDRTIAVRNVRP
jgi:fimbrial chaperone protein